MIKCPNPECSMENVDGTQFCVACGEELTAGAGTGVASTTGAAPAAGGEIKCPACDNMNPADNIVCEVCGTELHDNADAAQSTPAAAAPAIDPANAATSGPIAPADTASPAGMPVAPSTSPGNAGVATTLPGGASTAGTSDTTGASAANAQPPAVTGSNDAFQVPATTGPAPADTGTAVAPAASASQGMSATVTPAQSAPYTVPDADPTQAAAPPSTVTPTALPTTPPGLLGGTTLQPGRVKLTVEQGMSVGAQFVLGDPEMQVGREDEEEDIYPDIDLSDQDAGFVHRRHATLRFDDTGLTLTHLGGANKTRINNRPIPDNVPQPVNIGDKLAFGKVVVRVQPNP